MKQCQFESLQEHLIDTIVYSCCSKKAQDKLLQMPIRMNLEECLLICRHYESLQWHINTICPGNYETCTMEGIVTCWQKSKYWDISHNVRRARPQQQQQHTVTLYTQQMTAPPGQQLVLHVTRLDTFQISVDLSIHLLGSSLLLHNLQLGTGMDAVEAKVETEVINQDVCMKLKPHRILQNL